MRKKCLLLVTVALIFVGLTNAQEIGDYRSAVSGPWATLANWETWDGGSWIVATALPTATNNVLVRNGHTISMGSSPYACRNLVVESGAVLYANSTTNRYINLSGDSVRCDGTIGSPTDGICFTCMTSVTFKGNGSYQVSRLRPGASNVTITIDRNFNLHYTAAAPNNVALYANSQTGCIIQVNDGDTLTFSSNSAFSWGTNSTTASTVGGTFFIDGTVIMPSGSNFNISVANGLSSLVHIYGNLVLGDTLIADAATTGDETVIVNGAITYTSTDTMKFDNLYTNNPSGTSFGFPVRVNGVLTVGWGDYDNSGGLTIADFAHIQRYTGSLTAAPAFEGWVNLEYGPNPAAAALTTGYEFPAADSTVYAVSFNNSAGVVLDKDVTCYGLVTLEDGIVTTGNFRLACYLGAPARNTGYVDGLLAIYIPTGNPNYVFHVGTANGYSPATIDFQNVTAAGGVGVRAVQSTNSDVNIPANTMQRYWNIGQHPVIPAVFDSCRIEFAYLPADFNTGFLEATDEAAMVVGKADSTGWTFPEISVRTPNGADDGGSIQISNLTTLSDFTMAKDQNSLAPDAIAPVIISTSPADGVTEVALDAPLYIVFSEPVDTLSLAGSVTPSPNEQPEWSASLDTLYLPHDPMATNTVYTVKIAALTDLAGNPLAVLPDSFMFTTVVGDTIRPYVVSVSPAWGATGVGLNDTIIIAFSEPMNTDSLDGFTDPFHDFTPSWNAAGDTFTLAPQDPYPYSTVMSVIVTSGIDLAGNSMAILPDTVVQFTSAPFQGPSITLVQQPEDTYDGTGPFPVRAVITDLGKAGIAADTLWYTDNSTDWWALTHASTDGDTFNYSIPGPLVAGTVIEFFFGAWDDGGTAHYDPSMYRGYQFRILDPLPPDSLTALASDQSVYLSWKPPVEVLDYATSNGTGTFQDAGDIVDTRFTPQHYPCKLEQAVSSWWYAAGSDFVTLHVWGDDGTGLPDRSTDLVPPHYIMPLDYPNYTVVDLSSHNLYIASGDFHIGYVIQTDNLPMPLCDGDGPGLRSLVYDSSTATWGSLILNTDEYRDWAHQSVVSYQDYTKGLALKSYLPKPGEKPLPVLTGIKSMPVGNKQTPVYPKLEGALALAKNITGFNIFRGDVSGGPYASIGLAGITPAYTDNSVINDNTYYYVVRSEYSTPDTFSAWSNEASATPTGVEGRPEVRAYVLQLRAAAPNPMTTGTAIRFSLPASAQASLEVFNVLGQKVTTLANGKLDAGYHTVNWDGTDRHGAKLASGVYLYQLRTMNKTLTKRITILR
ncbi:MAG: Ig-like domain-containing protein [Candidatus Edwardsbacteria bacterium]|nr:Ig-like domain-containing protein [Candidatus Edwardsbacteria bacterium]